jgi:hypothetical protein
MTYEDRLESAQDYARKEQSVGLTQMRIPPVREGSWNDLFLAGLYRNGLMLTQQGAYMLMHDDRYPSGRPITAPRPTSDEKDLWPADSWIIFRD